jgi:CRP-like cAMP-binding protein
MTISHPRPFLHQNRLLRALPASTVQPFLLTLQPVALRLKESLMTRHEPITAVYFPLDAVMSVVSTLADGTMVEVGTIGNEGMVGISRFFQADSMPFTALTQVPGAALKMDVEAFDEAVGTVGSDFSRMLARYSQAWCTQLGQHAVCNRVHQRRTSVTGVARQLQQKGLIQYRRGMIHVLDRPGLETASCECYGIIAQETDRLAWSGAGRESSRLGDRVLRMSHAYSKSGGKA